VGEIAQGIEAAFKLAGRRTAKLARRIGVRVRRLRGLFRLRGWILLLCSAGLFVVVFVWSEAVTRLSQPPSTAPAVDIVVPVSTRSYVGDLARLGVEIGVRGCRNPVTVVVSLGAPEAGGKRNWLVRRSRVSFGVSDSSARGFRLFVGDPSSDLDRIAHLSFHGSSTLFEIASGNGKGLEADLQSRGRDATVVPNLRGIVGTAPAISLHRDQSAPLVVGVFEANWITSRTFGTCYLHLPQVPQPGPNPILPLPGPANVVDTLGYQSAEVVVDDERFDGHGIGPLELLGEDSSPQPAATDPPRFACTGNQPACEGGYLALTTPNAAGRINSRLLLLGAILGVLAAIFAEQLIHVRWPLPRR
jgi:hypothetical protein